LVISRVYFTEKSKAAGYRGCRTAGDCNGTYETSMEQTISSTYRFTKLHQAQGDDPMRSCAYPHPAPVTPEEAAFDSVLRRSGGHDRSGGAFERTVPMSLTD
jgi:hypothetical protein